MSEHGQTTSGPHERNPFDAVQSDNLFKYLLGILSQPGPDSLVSFTRTPAVMTATEAYRQVTHTTGEIDPSFNPATMPTNITLPRRLPKEVHSEDTVVVSKDELTDPVSAVVVAKNTLRTAEHTQYGRLEVPSRLGVSLRFSLENGKFSLNYGLSRTHLHPILGSDLSLSAGHNSIAPVDGRPNEVGLVDVRGLDTEKEIELLNLIASIAGIAVDAEAVLGQ